MQKILRIGTRDSQLAVWQATLVQNLLKDSGRESELIYIKSEGDIDVVTPIYALGVQGVFTKTLDAALLGNRIDIAVHSMKDVPTLLAKGIRQAAVLERASTKDILVFKSDQDPELLGFDKGAWGTPAGEHVFTIGTSSIRRIAQWLNRYPAHRVENLRGNVNTRLRKLQENNWNGAIFAAAGLERIDLRPKQSIDLDWMLPAPAQGSIMVVCREDDDEAWHSCQYFNHEHTALCTKIERDFLRTLMGGCSTPISGLATVENSKVYFKGNVCSKDGRMKVDIEEEMELENAGTSGVRLGNQLLNKPSAAKIVHDIRNGRN
jgi:hydroxymethylbilane synthase